jgi:hypothetical protein
MVFDVAIKIARFDPDRAQEESAKERKKARDHIHKAHDLLLSSHRKVLPSADLNSAVADLINALTRVRHDIDAVSRRARSGGQVFKWQRKIYTAGSGYYLLKRYADEEPPYRGGDWVWFSEALFEIAIGERTDMSKACREWKQQQDEMIRAGIDPSRPRTVIWPKR